MKFCEYDTYKSIYCGLCKEMGKNFNILLRFTLSYDFAFLGLLDISLKNDHTEIKNEVCIAHPCKKTPCMRCSHLKYASDTAVISMYHKILDDTRDSSFFKKLYSHILLLFCKSSYNKAKSDLPELASTVEKYMQLQHDIESKKSKSIDEASEPTAQIMANIAENLSSDNNQKRILNRLGYLLGRYIYLIDALDDTNNDYKTGNYNPLLLQDGCENNNQIKINQIAKDSIMYTLGEIANAHILLDIKKYKPILDNIIYLGLNNTLISVLNKKEKNND